MTNYKKIFLLIALILLLKLILIASYNFIYPSEARYASIAMRMALTNNYLMPYFTPLEPFFGKPPFAFWMSALSFKILGFREFSARLPHLLALLAICFLLYRFTKKTYDKKNAIIAIIILISCLLFSLLHSVMTESFLLLGMTLITLSFLLQMQSQQAKTIDGYLPFFGAAIAILTKGPVGVAFIVLAAAIFLTVTKKWKEFFQKFPLINGSLIFLLLTLPWFILAEKNYPGFLQYFLIGENFSRFANPSWSGDKYGHPREMFFGVIWLFTLIATFPVNLAIIFKPKIFFSKLKQEISHDHNLLFFTILFALTILVLTFMRNMIVTYAIFILLPFTLIFARIAFLQKWQNFCEILLYFTLILHFIALIAFVANPLKLSEKINYQSALFEQIPQKIRQDKDFQLYYLEDKRMIFPIYWHSHDRALELNSGNFEELLESDNEKKYIIGSIYGREYLKPEFQSQLQAIICLKNNEMCLYELINR